MLLSKELILKQSQYLNNKIKTLSGSEIFAISKVLFLYSEKIPHTSSKNL
jgi:hypothetical protein